MPDLEPLRIPSPTGIQTLLEDPRTGIPQEQWHLYALPPSIVTTFQELYDHVGDLFYGLGKDSKDLPTLDSLTPFRPDISDLSGAYQLQMNYAGIVAGLQQTATQLNANDKTVLETIKLWGDTETDLQTTLNTFINNLTAQASNPPPQVGQPELDYVNAYLSEARDTYTKDLAAIHKQAQDHADLLNQTKPGDDTPKPGGSTSTSQSGSPYNPPPASQTGSTSTGPTTSTSTGDGYTPISTGSSYPYGSTSTSGYDPYGNTGGTGNTGNTGGTGYPGTGTGAGTGTDGTGNGYNAGNATPASAGTGGADLSSLMSMLPMLMSMMQNRGLDQNQNADPYGRDPYGDRYGQYPPYAQAQPAQPQTQPAQSTPQSAPAQTQGPSSGATSNQPAGNAPGTRTPDADGTVTYTFPDGQTQKVSLTVAKALDVAFGNQKSTDAQAAYAGTSAKWADKKTIGASVDPYQLMTGDIATWENATAIVRVMGSGTDGTLDVIVDGQLKPFAPDMSGAAGEFGAFTGFQHPNGIEVTNATETGTDGAAAVPGDPSGGTAAAAVPAVAPA
ncbi:hypothetical protein [Nocardia aurantia]|uniref:Uncharacterized protein n=1 Tax=Nocardia aurantia TaxID=2585199 RepID=A0A7K0DRJ0_9NOCA|nr:hypothetical protein [Nocardia aurantia]MQY28218.1 hypothetical protein [Nocardia aurantia]